MKKHTKIILVISILLIIVLAWAPWITDEYAKNKVIRKVCSSVEYKNGSEICILNSNFQGGSWEGTGMLIKDIVAGVIWVPFGRYVTNFEGMEFVPFYG